MQYQLVGEIAQYVRMQFEPGENAWASNGALMSYSSGMFWDLRLPGGLSGALRRSFAGEGVSLTYLEAKQAGQYALLVANLPGHIRSWDLTSDGAVITTQGAFLAAWGSDINIDVTVARRAGAAMFGGAGLFLQKVSGKGTTLVHGSGDFEERFLEKGEQLFVSTGNLAAFAETVDYSIQAVGSFRRYFFGAEGLFVTRLTGPGRVLLQSLKR